MRILQLTVIFAPKMASGPI